MDESRKILNDSLFYVFSKFIPGVISLAFLYLIIELVGLDEYGKYSLKITQYTLIASFCFGWINQSQLRYESSKKTKKITLSIDIILVASITVFFVVAIINFYGTNTIEERSVIKSFICVLSIGFFSYYKTCLQSSFFSKSILFLTIAQSVFFISIPLIIKNYMAVDSEYLALSTAASFFVASLFLMLIKLKLLEFEKIKIKNSILKIKKWIIFGLPVSAWASIGLLLPFLDRYFISIYLSDFDAGQFSSIDEISKRIFSFIIFPFTMALHPRLTKLWDENRREKVESILFKFIIVLFSFFAFSAILLSIFKLKFFFLFETVIPSISENSIDLIFPLVLSGIIWQISFLTHKIIEFEQKTYLMTLLIIGSVIINIFGNYFYLPRYGIITTAYTSLISSTFYCVGTLLFSIKFLIKSKY